MKEEIENQKESKPQSKQPKVKTSPPPPPKLIVELIESGIRLKRCIFTRTVSSRFGTGGKTVGTPCTAFFAPEPGLKNEKAANMWYTPHGVVCEQEGYYKLIPLAAVIDTDVL